MKGKTIIKVEGQLDAHWKEAFAGMDIYSEGGNTIITGVIRDEAHMHGLLHILRDVNLKLISINRAENETDPNRYI